jgi:hypothetical protein
MMVSAFFLQVHPPKLKANGVRPISSRAYSRAWPPLIFAFNLPKYPNEAIKSCMDTMNN